MTDKANQIKAVVREKYGEMARQSKSCCGPNCCSPEDSITIDLNYKQVEGYVPEADLGLGCGLPTQFAQIKAGETVVDLGSGAGNDVFIARRLVGETGRVIGVDMTPDMIARANENKAKLGFTNVEFRLGEIEQLPVDANSADLVLSNCVLNLVPDKARAFAEIHRVLKPGGRFSISDIVIEGKLPDSLRDAVKLYVGCVAGALTREEYLGTIDRTGFQNVTVHSRSVIELPADVLKQYVSQQEIEDLAASGTKVTSITVTGLKR